MSNGQKIRGFTSRPCRKALHLQSKSSAHIPKSAGSALALVIGELVPIMLVAAAIVPAFAFDQTTGTSSLIIRGCARARSDSFVIH